MNGEDRARLARSGLVLYGFVLYHTLLTPAPVFQIPPQDGPRYDLIGHTALFFILAILVWWAAHGLPLRARLGIVVMTGVGIGLLSEWAQGLVPGRTPDLLDAGADVVGTMMAVALIAILHRRPRDPVALS